MASVEELLKRREAQGLRWGASVRLVIIGLGALMLPSTSMTFGDTAFTSAVLVVGAAISIYAYRLARGVERLGKAGWMCVAFDVTTLVTLPLSWYEAVGGAAMMTPSFLLKTDLVPVCLMLIAANGMTLRPVYPLVVTGASLALYGGFLAYALTDPRVAFRYDIAEAVMGPAVHPGLFVWRMLTIAFFGGLFAWSAAQGHRTVRQAVELEHANAEARRLQGELVLQGRLSALAGLVAGVAHEVNSPLGVVRSSVQTIASAAKRLTGEERVMGVLAENVATAGEATGRIDALVRRLRDFAGLDQADVQEIDLETALDRTLDLIGPEVRRAARVEREYAGGVRLTCRAKEISQVFFTVLRNAFEAIDGEGAVRLETARGDGGVAVTIADTGRGMPPADVASLFEIRFSAKDRRMSMGLGLAMARSIVERHGGRIEAQSTVGEGTRFVIHLRDKGHGTADKG